MLTIENRERGGLSGLPRKLLKKRPEHLTQVELLLGCLPKID
jgi:hypothetical protein